MQSRRILTTVATLSVGGLALTGCAGGGDGDPAPSITGEATSYDSLEGLRDLYVEAGGDCPEWEEIDPGEYDAQAGRCSDQVVIAIYNDTTQIDEVVDRALDLMMPTHMIVGENWIINTPDPDQYVAALGGMVVSG
ncbi:MAG: hypothetical protein ACTHXA_11025 [Gulosibacter sp.]|uniref:hypothetical protein n=1 Tax=Gulosibacter sp. TaxID=2817531 RepID=UPI003F91FD55